jgi:cyclophilin family peptidyl-prolyl cis-trans isomerase
MRLSTCIAVVSLAVGCATPRPAGQDFSSVEKARIAQLEDSRDTRDGALASRARIHADPAVRARALLALARVQDFGTAPQVAEALTDPVPSVRAMAAFAAGELGLAWQPVPDNVREQLTQALLRAEERESDPQAHLVELDALGRVRTAAALERLASRLDPKAEAARALGGLPPTTPGDSTTAAFDVATRSAVALGVAARAKATVPATAQAPLGVLATSYLVPTRWAAVYALGQMKLADARPVLLHALTDVDGEVRAIAVKGLAEVVLPEDVPVLRPLLRDDDGRVAAEAVKALVKLAERCTPGPCLAIDALGDLEARMSGFGAAALEQLVPPVLALAQSAVPEGGRRILSATRARLRAAGSALPEPVHDTASWLDCRLAAAQDRQRGWLDEVLACGGGRVSDARRLKLGLDSVAQSPRLPGALDRASWAPLLKNPSASVRAAAASVAGASKRKELAPDVRPLLRDPDLLVRASATEALAALDDADSAQVILDAARTAPVDVVTTYADALVALKPPGATQVLQGWLSAPHAHVRQEAARALTALQGGPVNAPALPAKGDAPPATPLAAGTLWRWETVRGPVVIRPDADAAPVTVAQLSRLAAAGYFKGLTFHRVVPDFVVQGGDPRGDGEGGPGFSLRCEVSPRGYVRGTVGMALAGKDTGGSQVFVTLSPQPHLDGRYTIIGTVISGMESLDGLAEGDGMGDWLLVPP